MELVILSEDPQQLRLQCRGKISQNFFNGSDPFERIVGSLNTGLARAIHVDLSKADWIDSSGIGWLLKWNNQTKQAGGAFSLCNIPPRVSEVLRFCKLDRYFNILPDSNPSA